jgi:hypothetical protein
VSIVTRDSLFRQRGFRYESRTLRLRLSRMISSASWLIMSNFLPLSNE